MTTRLVLVGDSHLALIRGDLLDELEAALPCPVVNLAVGGRTSVDLLHAGDDRIAHDDAVVVSVGSNDAAPWKEVPLPTFASSVGALLALLEPRRVLLVAPPPVDQRLHRRARLAEGSVRANDRLREYGEVLAELAADRGQAWFDTLGALGADGGLHRPDGVHLNAAGYARLLPPLARAAADLLSAPGPGRSGRF